MVDQDEFDEFIRELQEEIDNEVREGFSENAINLAIKKPCWGRMQNPDGYSCIIGECGDKMEFFVKVDEKGTITDASFFTTGCSPTIAAASQAALLAKGKQLKEVLGITGEEILAALGRLPPENEHCPRLAAEALKEAARSCLGQVGD